MCRHLRSVWLNEGLKVLGAGQQHCGDTRAGYVFADSTIASLTVPANVKGIERAALDKCETIKRVEFREGRETLGMGEEGSDVWNALFRDCGVEEVVLPSTLREISPDIFKGCKSLKIVRVAKGCAVNVRKLVGFFVKVRQK